MAVSIQPRGQLEGPDELPIGRVLNRRERDNPGGIAVGVVESWESDRGDRRTAVVAGTECQVPDELGELAQILGASSHGTSISWRSS